MKTKVSLLLVIIVSGMAMVSNFMAGENYHHAEFSLDKNLTGSAIAYPPAVGILGNSKNCVVCHVSNGTWKEDENLIIDVLDKSSKKSLKKPDGSFLIEAARGEAKTVLTVIGRKNSSGDDQPYRNAWLYIDPATIGTSSLSKFAPGWEVNLPMACRLTGDKLEGYDNARITSLPMTVRPGDAARDADIQLQVMLTKGESVKGKAEEGLISNYFERKVKLVVK